MAFWEAFRHTRQVRCAIKVKRGSPGDFLTGLYKPPPPAPPRPPPTPAPPPPTPAAPPPAAGGILCHPLDGPTFLAMCMLRSGCHGLPIYSFSWEFSFRSSCTLEFRGISKRSLKNQVMENMLGTRMWKNRGKAESPGYP